MRLSTRYRVLSPHTALPVLENDSDYARFNIDLRAKVDILTVKDGRIAMAADGRPELPPGLLGASSVSPQGALRLGVHAVRTAPLNTSYVSSIGKPWKEA